MYSIVYLIHVHVHYCSVLDYEVYVKCNPFFKNSLVACLLTGEATFSSMTGPALVKVVDVAYQETSKHLLHVLHNKYNFVKHLKVHTCEHTVRIYYHLHVKYCVMVVVFTCTCTCKSICSLEENSASDLLLEYWGGVPIYGSP